MDIGERIKTIRGKRSRTEFAESLGIHPQTLYLYEKGKRVVDVELIQQLCIKFNVSVEWLVFGEGGLQALAGASGNEMSESLREKDALLAERNVRIGELKDELIVAQAEAIKAYDLAVETIQTQNEMGEGKSPYSRHTGKQTERKTKHG